MRNNIINSILEHKIIAIIRKVDMDKILYTAEALYNGGIRFMEVTFDQSGDFSESYTTDQIALLKESFGKDLYVGAGTVMTPKQVEAAYHAGARYIISPNTDKAVINKTLELGMVSIPGAVTPTEIQQAHAFGADFVKLFPAGELGLDYIKAVLAPLNHIKMLAVGGINENNLKDFLNTSLKGVGIGSNIVKNGLIVQGKYDQITALTKKYTSQTNSRLT